MELSQLTTRIKTRRFAAVSSLLIVNTVVFGGTNPLDSSVLLIILGFIVLSIDIVVFVFVALRLLGSVFPYIRSRVRRLSAVISGFGIILLALSSIGQLTLRDVLAVLAVAAVVYFYSMYFHLGARRTD